MAACHIFTFEFLYQINSDPPKAQLAILRQPTHLSQGGLLTRLMLTRLMYPQKKPAN